jgi:hypothetical protein
VALAGIVRELVRTNIGVGTGISQPLSLSFFCALLMLLFVPLSFGSSGKPPASAVVFYSTDHR